MISTYRLITKASLLLGLIIFDAAHAQQPGVDCAPVQGQGWQGCAPLNNGSTQQAPQQQPSQPPPRWMDQWGAIATDEPKGILGAATGLSSKLEAQQSALADCAGKGGAPCKLEIAYNNQCAALVVGDKVYNTSSAATIQQASQSGMDRCSKVSTNCHVYYSACSMPVRIQ